MGAGWGRVRDLADHIKQRLVSVLVVLEKADLRGRQSRVLSS